MKAGAYNTLVTLVDRTGIRYMVSVKATATDTEAVRVAEKFYRVSGLVVVARERV